MMQSRNNKPVDRQTGSISTAEGEQLEPQGHVIAEELQAHSEFACYPKTTMTEVATWCKKSLILGCFASTFTIKFLSVVFLFCFLFYLLLFLKPVVVTMLE